jgi:hypothetical protein
MSFRTLAEFVPLLAAVLLAGLMPSDPARVWAVPSEILRVFSRTPRRAIASSVVMTLALCGVLRLLAFRWPSVPDEFSYLLASDTFAHGRLTNPPHPLWEHFETLHVLQTPTYQSKYPPGQGLFLAAGQALTGSPITGVWLSMAAGAAAVCWMLLAWMPPRWALVGALLPAFRFGALPLWDDNWFAYWSTTYWGGAVAMLGGALLFGALPRLLRTNRPRDATLLAAGLIVLANTRPYEGLVAALPAACMLAAWARPRWRQTLRAAESAGAVLLLGVLAMAYYNYRVTGDALRMPYQVYTEQYDVAPIFIFGQPRTGKTYNHASMRAYHQVWVMEGYRQKRSGAGLRPQHLALPLQFFWGFALWLPVLFALGRPARRWALFATAVLILSILASAASSFADRLRPHYIAPAAPMFVFLAVAGLRRLRVMQLRGRRLGRPLAEALVAVALLSIFVGLAFRAVFGAPYQDAPLVRDRPAIVEHLGDTPGKHLVLVHYSGQHNEHDEWVYNGADLDGARIVWARDMGPENNRRLLDYYAGRKIWRLYADELPARLEAYERPRQ